jgi:hypothetical protein
MGLDDGARMTQSPPALLAVARPRWGGPLTDCLTLWRVLKTRTVRRLRVAAPRLGDHERQRQRGWAPDTTGGLEALRSRQPRAGRREQLRAAAGTALAIAMPAGRLARLTEGPRSWRAVGDG